MNSNEDPKNELQAFTELLGDNHFDDSVCDEHQSDLRSKVLQAFDQADRELAIAELPVRSANQRQWARRRRSLGYGAILAVCLIGLVAFWFYRGNEPANIPIANPAPAPEVTEDSQLLESLAAVNAFRDVVSPEAFFGALAMCQQDYEGRMSDESIQP